MSLLRYILIRHGPEKLLSLIWRYVSGIPISTEERMNLNHESKIEPRGSECDQNTGSISKIKSYHNFSKLNIRN